MQRSRYLSWIALSWAIAGCGTTSQSGGIGLPVDAVATDSASADTAGATGDSASGDIAASKEDVGADADGADADGVDSVSADSADSADSAGCVEGAACDDGDNCTKDDSCKAGVCVGAKLVCDNDLPVCKQGACEPANGICLVKDKDGACDDGDPCTQADSCVVGACIGFKKPGCCTASCSGKACGDDGCGGSCGGCKVGDICANGTCATSANAGETCADATTIPSLPYTHSGTTLGTANDLQAPAKACLSFDALGTYGPDVVYRYKAATATTLHLKLTGYANKPALYAFTDCADIKNSCVGAALGYGQPSLESYVPVAAGEEVFLVVDADLAGGDYTLNVDGCTPSCSGKQCGTDGCGGVCGNCAKLSAYNCTSNGTCLCVPNCDQKVCGDNGCGGSCGTCAVGQICDGEMLGAYVAQCVGAGQAGDRCDNPIVVDTSPFSYSGTTVGLGNDLYAWAFCDGDGTGAYYGDEAPDMAFSLGGKAATSWYVQLTKKSTNLEIYALTDCADPISCKQAGYKGFTLKTQLFVESPTGAPIFVAVDGYNNQAGTFTLEAKQCSKASDCPEGDVGQYCSLPVVVDALPYSGSGQIGLDSYRLPKGACGAKKVLGAGGGNRAYQIVAAKSGSHTATVKGSGGTDPILYVAQDCTQLATSCVAFADTTDQNGTEVVTWNANAGEAVYLVVDAQTSIGGSFTINAVGP